MRFSSFADSRCGLQSFQTILSCAAVFIVAVLYSSAGQAGASGYIASIAVFGFPPEVLRPTALLLNIAVALVASVQYVRERQFFFRLFWPFAAGSLPFAFAAGATVLPSRTFAYLVGGILIVAGVAMFAGKKSEPDETRNPPIVACVLCGAAIGWVSGLTGIGGGIFLMPLLLMLRWADVRTAAATATFFILANSVAALAGYVRSAQPISNLVMVFILPAIGGGVIGSRLGSRYLPRHVVRLILGLLLVLTGLKLIVRG